ncbi:hypothetical protein QZH41_000277 [Actinostola sp. cb2023]|nr:hypothetical protein QZH41_000277 [Actinostola sp. cb2023]
MRKDAVGYGTAHLIKAIPLFIGAPIAAWIGSLAIGFSFFCGPIAVKVIDSVGERTVGVCGGLVASLLLAVSSFVDNILILYFSHGVLLGICGSFILNSLLLIVRKYFKDKLAVAIGITSSGSSLGVLSLGPALQVLNNLLGWRGSFRVMSGVMLLVALLSFVYDPNIKDDEHNKGIAGRREQTRKRFSELIDCSIWRSSQYIVGITAVFLTYFGLFVPSIHLIRFAEDRDITSSKSSLLFIYIGVFSTVIRLVVGKLMDKRWLTPLQGVQLSSFTIAQGICELEYGTNYVVYRPVYRSAHCSTLSRS